MLGAIAGDIIGSLHEYSATKRKNFVLFEPGSRFTDDSVLTVAVADSLLRGAPYLDKLHEYFRAYPGAGYGSSFHDWAREGRREPYNSWGNGSAMRVSPVGFARESLEEVLAEAARSAEPTHNHAEGVRGAQATAAAIYLARTGHSKAEIRRTIIERFGYDLDRRLDDIRPEYRFNESCHGTVPQSIIAFLESDDYEDAIRNAISLGGDADTLACITGGIAEAFYGGVPPLIARLAMMHLDDRLKQVTTEFYVRFMPAPAPWLTGQRSQAPFTPTA
jgi:ADP-ribosylglycohydrolase